jgi:thioester reductase-like protein
MQSPDEVVDARATRTRGSHYDPARSPALRSKYADIVSLDTGDRGYLELVADEAARERIAHAGARTDWGRDVLVLGGNGFIGAHLVHRLLADPRVKRVRTIVRPRAGLGARDRLLSTWSAYELSPAMVDLRKMTVLDGSSCVRNFGLTDEEYADLAQHVDSVFDCAGSGDYSRSYLELRSDWVLGVLGVLQFCLDRSVKQLTYLGSTSAHMYSSREDLARPDSWWGSGYTQVKWVNHGLVSSAARLGVRATLCEAPHVLGSTTVGRDPGAAYGFWRIIKLSVALRVAWDGEFPVFVPVDVLADAIVKNALSAQPISLLRPLAPWRFRIADLAPLLGCRMVSWKEFLAEVARHAGPDEMRMLPDDAPEAIEKTNVPAIYPSGYDLTRFPSSMRLGKLYLNKMGLASKPAAAGAPR